MNKGKEGSRDEIHVRTICEVSVVGKCATLKSLLDLDFQDVPYYIIFPDVIIILLSHMLVS